MKIYHCEPIVLSRATLNNPIVRKLVNGELIQEIAELREDIETLDNNIGVVAMSFARSKEDEFFCMLVFFVVTWIVILLAR